MSIEILTKKDLEIFGNNLIDQLVTQLKITKKDYYTKEEALKALNCSERTLENLRGARKIAFTGVGREYQYTIKSVNDLLDSKLIDVVQ